MIDFTPPPKLILPERPAIIRPAPKFYLAKPYVMRHYKAILPGMMAPIFPIGGIGGIDADTLLMLHCDGADASTALTDSSMSARTVTAYGNAQIDTAQSVFGGASALFDGSGDYLSVPDHADWDLGTGNFTVDTRVRFNALSGFQGIMVLDTYTTGIRILSNGSSSFEMNVVGTDCSETYALSTATWYHLALVRISGTVRFFVNGTQVGTDTTAAGNITGLTLGLFVGVGTSTSVYPLNGWIDEFRFSKVARWTTTFTPPTEPYS